MQVSEIQRIILQKHAAQKGISYLELIIVVVILGIVAAAAMPNLSSTDPKKLDNAANEVAEAIRFARAEAIRTKVPRGINTDATNDRIRVYSLPVSTPTYDIYHPIDKKLYDLQLKTDAYVGGVDLVSASFAFTGSYSSSTNLDFSTGGYPKYTSVGNDYMLTSGAITLSYRGQQRIISIAPMTGRVTIQ
jgi:Tfp pilus assembly protein FimT